MDRNKLCYETPRTEAISLRFEGIICQSGDEDENVRFNKPFNTEEEW